MKSRKTRKTRSKPDKKKKQLRKSSKPVITAGNPPAAALPKSEELESQQCKATSKTSGNRCKQPAIPGGTVCIYHGGKAPQVMRAARARLRELLLPALDRLEKNLENTDGWVGTKAVDQVLRYTDVKGPEKHEHKVAVYDPEKFASLTDEELENLRGLAEKLVSDPTTGGNPGGDTPEGETED